MYCRSSPGTMEGWRQCWSVVPASFVLPPWRGLRDRESKDSGESKSPVVSLGHFASSWWYLLSFVGQRCALNSRNDVSYQHQLLLFDPMYIQFRIFPLSYSTCLMVFWCCLQCNKALSSAQTRVYQTQYEPYGQGTLVSRKILGLLHDKTKSMSST